MATSRCSGLHSSEARACKRSRSLLTISETGAMMVLTHRDPMLALVILCSQSTRFCSSYLQTKKFGDWPVASFHRRQAISCPMPRNFHVRRA